MTIEHTVNQPINGGSSGSNPFSGRGVGEWLFAGVALAAAFWSVTVFGSYMDGYERAILVLSAPALIALAWFWKPVRSLSLVVASLSGLAIWLYQGEGGATLGQADQVFWLKYFLSSQSAILWMCVLVLMSTVAYWMAMLGRSKNGFSGPLASALAWSSVAAALVGSFVRWYESYLIGADVGHIPVSNLYEVFVLFCWMTTAFCLYFESKYGTRSFSAFAMLIVCAAVGFLVWYSAIREAHEIQPLVPALQSWWMKLHVPANFIGYGTFALAAMVAFAYLIKHSAGETRWWRIAPLWALGVVLCFEPLVFRRTVSAGAVYWTIYAGLAAVIVAAIVSARVRIAARLPELDVLDDVMYKAIAIGFAFFTIATVLGALWAAEAWGGYWSWDPKETWALIVWLNYASWLHMRMIKGLRGPIAAWWALVGLAVTTFAFLGVNMFLSGLHSYGNL